MSRRLILSLAILGLAAGPALAAEKKEGKEDKEGAAGLYVDISPVGLPIIWKGRLINYVFTSVRVLLASGANVESARTKEPYFRDALVRTGHRTPYLVAGDANKVDEAAIRRTMAVEAARIAGPRAVAGIQVMSQTPKRRVAFPAP